MLPGPAIGSVGCALLAAFGLYRLYQYYIFHRRVHSAGAWPETAGLVVEGHTGYTPGMRGAKYYYARLNYRYHVQGHEYTGVLEKHTLLGEGQARRLLDKYPTEGSLKIHYNPLKPAEHLSTVDKSRTDLVVSLAIFLLGVLGVLSAFASVGS
jgi:hypothetical protein